MFVACWEECNRSTPWLSQLAESCSFVHTYSLFSIFQHLFILWFRDESEILPMLPGSSPHWHRQVFVCANCSCWWHCRVPEGPGRNQVGHCETPKPKYLWNSVGLHFARAGIWEKNETEWVFKFSFHKCQPLLVKLKFPLSWKGILKQKHNSI